MALDFKKVDMSMLKKMADPKAAGDLNAFLEKLPQNAGQTILIAAGIAWAMAGALGLYTSIQVRQLAEFRAELAKADALAPVVPKISDVPIDPTQVAEFIKKVSSSYPGLTMTANGSSILITSPQTSDFARFREAMGHMQNGGSGWRVTLEKLCVGRECPDNQKLAVSLKVNKVSVENPATAAPASN